MMKQLEVQIMGQSYLLGCPEGGEGRLLEAVARVDTAMCKIRDAGKVKARDRTARKCRPAPITQPLGASNRRLGRRWKRLASPDTGQRRVAAPLPVRP